jgi:hypothetical protein
MNLKCEYCSKVYSSKCNLSTHQRTAKFCLKIQNKILENAYTCKDCKYTTGRISSLTTHLKTCKKKKKREIKQVSDKDLIIALKDQQLIIQEGIIKELKKEAFKPKTINNNNNVTYNIQMEYCKQNLAPYEEFLKDAKKLIWTHFKTSYLLKGVDGIVLLLNKILPNKTPRYLLSFENSKQSFYRNKDDKIELDDKADKLLTDIHPFIMEKVNEKYKEELTGADVKEMQELSDLRYSIIAINEMGSKERKKCVRAISDTFYVSNNTLKIQN